MKRWKRSLLGVLVLSASIVTTQADVVIQEWQSFEFVVTDDSGCLGENGVAQGRVHTKLALLKKGNIALNINAQGVVTGIDTGAQWRWKDNITDVIPVSDENFVYTFQQQLRLIGGPKGSLSTKVKFHVTVIGGEIKSYMDSSTFECRSKSKSASGAEAGSAATQAPDPGAEFETAGISQKADSF